MHIFSQIARFIRQQRLYLLYAFYAVPAGLFLLVATPPFQTPDAINHFYRAVQVSDGHLLAQRLGGTSGGPIDASVVAFADMFDHMRFHPEVKYDAPLKAAANELRWSGNEMIAQFPGAAIYPAYAYLPQALAIRVGRVFHMTVVRTYTLACVVDLLVSIGLTCWALAVSRRTSLLIFATGLLPSTLMLVSSVSHEVLLLPACFLLIAYVDRFIHDGQCVYSRWLVFAAAVLLLCISSRPPYVGLLLLFLCPGVRVGYAEGGYGLWRRLAWCGAVALLSVVVIEIFSRTAWAPVPLPRSIAGQAQYLLHQPLDIFHIAVSTFRQNGEFYYLSFVGILGWLDTHMSPTYYVSAVLMMLVALVGTFFRGCGTQKSPIANRVCIFMTATSCVAMIFGSLYLSWTPVRQPVVDGVQGRYFLGLVPLLGLLLPALVGRGRVLMYGFAYVEAICIAIVAVFPLYTFVELVEAIITRFYV
jgi:uncharacterized membrane protein